MAALSKRSARMTVPEFIAWEPADGGHYELVDGEPRAMAPPGTVHGYLQSRLATLLTNHLDRDGSACSVVATPGVLPHMLSAHNLRIPDLGVTCSPLAPGQGILPNPVVLIEILSPSNAAQTWSNVWAHTSIPGLQEILVLDSTRIAAEMLRRSPDGTWPDQPALLQADLTLASLEFHVALPELYARTGLTT